MQERTHIYTGADTCFIFVAIRGNECKSAPRIIDDVVEFNRVNDTSIFLQSNRQVNVGLMTLHDLVLTFSYRNIYKQLPLS